MTKDNQDKKTIGILIDCLHESYQSNIWEGISKAAQENNINVISFVATSQDKTSHFHVHYPVVSDFIKNSYIDGLIILAGSIAEHRGMSFATDFVNQFSDKPIINISTKIGDFPSVEVDNSEGIIKLIDHFIEIHNLHDIAFVTGPKGHEEADERLEAYKTGLIKNNLPIKNELIIDGDFSNQSGHNAVKYLIENKIKFQAIIAADDKAAFGVIEELKKYRLHVPTDIAVAGFDDVEDAALFLPSLTTVSQPLEELGKQAVLSILKIINGLPSEKNIKLAAIPVFRRSCGCFSESVRNARTSTPTDAILNKEEIIESLIRVCNHYIQNNNDNCLDSQKIKSYIEDFVDSLKWDVEKASIREIFLNEIDMLLFKFEDCSDNISLMSSLLSELSVHLKALFKSVSQIADAGAIIQQAQSFIRERKLSTARTTFLQDVLFQLMIRETSQSIITTFEQRKLLQAIFQSFPDLNINTLVFAVFHKENSDDVLAESNWEFPKKSQLLLGYNNSLNIVSFPRGDNLFDTGDLFPPDLIDKTAGENYIHMPLFFEDEYLGYAIFGFTKGIPLFMFEELRLHMSSALKSSFLMKELRVQSMLDELTGLHNRRGFMHEAKKMIRQHKKGEQYLMLFYADMDDLKIINDTFGHEEGDVAIRQTAVALRQTFREQDLIARIGGDEFIIVLTTSQENLMLEKTVLRRLENILLKYNHTSNKKYILSISMGVTSTIDNSDKDLETLMREADGKLFEMKRVKKRGRDFNV
ncbi:MAG: GGDEF domain-containing protein [Deltaproteobacteria bacterium]|nr:GGDEF domain-containing protein [Deltaproteobacteria bacterium]